MINRILVIVWCAASLAYAGGGEELYRRVEEASVEVFVGGRHAGSGWLADAKGLIVTAGHVVYSATNVVEVTSPVIGRTNVSVVAVDRGHDLALLQAPAGKKPYPFLRVADAIPEPATEIYLFGSPIFRHGFLLSGRVARSTIGYEYHAGMKCHAQVYYVSSPSPKGTSGGCWVDDRGRVVGDQSGMISSQGNSVGIAFVAPPAAIRELVRTRRAPSTADMRIVVEELCEKPVEFIKKYPPRTEGVVVVRLFDDADRSAGLTNDAVIVALDRQPIRLRDEFFNYVRSRKSGDEVVVRSLMPGKPVAQEMRVRLGSLD